MKVLRLVALTGFLVSCTGISRANLGDTEAQCLAKYGAESDVKDGLGYDAVGDRAATFHVKTAVDSLVLTVIFLNGIAVHERISNADASRGLSEDRMKALLQAESRGLKWQKRNSIFRTDNSSGITAGSENWVRSDRAIATFSVLGKTGSPALSGEIELSTRPYADAKAFFDKQDGGN
jgi:hypothetical protein